MSRSAVPSWRGAAIALAALLCLGATANDPAERLKNPAQEAHARSLFRQIRCLVCQNESIDDSEAPLAGDLRRIIRQQVAAGDSDVQIRKFLTDRYGEFVLLKPRFSPGNAVLWLTPFAVVVLGGAALALNRRRDRALEPPLSPAEEARLATLADRQPPDMLSPQMRLSKGQDLGGK
jgi:cytochrome c-type biogenesis protein CcmH